MSISAELRERIEATIAGNNVVLYMKGTRQQPQCGFSATVVGILDNLIGDYDTVNVLEDPEVRDGIKSFSQWPTIPQLYVNQEFLGGCDVIQQMYNAGELHSVLGLDAVEAKVPELTISDSAAAAINHALAQHQGAYVHLKVSPNYQHEFSLAPAKGHEIKASANGIEVLFDLDSAARADGLEIDMTEEGEQGFVIHNPNAPPPVQQMSVQALKALLDSGQTLKLYDVRDESERRTACIAGSEMLDEAAANAIEALPKDEMLIFHCHHGARSQQAAEYFRQLGFTDVHNVTGGIDAWALEIDSSIARY